MRGQSRCSDGEINRLSNGEYPGWTVQPWRELPASGTGSVGNGPRDSGYQKYT
jgi:hypothetical protein